MFENVVDLGLKFKRKRTVRKNTVRLIVHNVGGEMSVQAIHDMHNNDKKSNYNGIAYNGYVDLDGSCYWGRGLEYQGGATLESLGLNPTSFHLVANGDYNSRTSMPEAQKNAFIQFARDVCDYYGISDIKGHREVGDTDCPGRYFPLDEIRNAILAKEEPKPMPNRSEVEKYVDRLYRKVLNREPDAGRQAHISALMNRTLTPTQVAYNFYFSEEALRHREANEKFIPELYRGMMGREPSAAEVESWAKRIYKDMSREDLFCAFAGSDEFKAVEKGMGF